MVADRIIRFAQVVGRENVIAGTDCGLGGRVHPQIAWAKLGRYRKARNSRQRNYGLDRIIDGVALHNKKLRRKQKGGSHE